MSKLVKRTALILGILLLLISGGFVTWASLTNPLMPTAQEALRESASISVVVSGDLFVFRPRGQEPKAGYVFYPGGRVDYRAYAPYARAVAAQGYLVAVPKMPLNLAVFSPDAAQAVMSAYPNVEQWAVGGHSLGGSMAAGFASRNRDAVRGLVLLASYPVESDDLSQSDLLAASIYASGDRLATPQDIESSRSLLPAGAAFVRIEGGNHAQFGDYGVQGGDGEASITRAEQQRLAVEATVALLEQMAEGR